MGRGERSPPTQAWLGRPPHPGPSVPAFSSSRWGLQSLPWPELQIVGPSCTGSHWRWREVTMAGSGGTMVSMGAGIPLPEGPGAGTQPPLELARHPALAPRCPRLCPSPEVQGTPSDQGGSGSVLREPQAEGERGRSLHSHMAGHYCLRHPIMIVIFSLCLRLPGLCLFRELGPGLAALSLTASSAPESSGRE